MVKVLVLVGKVVKEETAKKAKKKIMFGTVFWKEDELRLVPKDSSQICQEMSLFNRMVRSWVVCCFQQEQPFCCLGVARRCQCLFCM